MRINSVEETVVEALEIIERLAVRSKSDGCLERKGALTAMQKHIERAIEANTKRIKELTSE